MNQFWANGSKEAIREYTSDIPEKFKLRSIYITPHNPERKGQKLEQLWEYNFAWPQQATIRMKKVRFRPISNPIYICPGDIIYLSEIDNIDVDTFISEKGNHIIEHLAIHSYTAMELGRTAFWDFLRAAQAGTLIHGLPVSKHFTSLRASTRAQRSAPHTWETTN